MAKKKKAEEAPAGAPLWMSTFADMVTLLLAFFVMLLSFSSIQESKFMDAKQSLEAAFGVLQNPPTVIEQREIIMPEPDDPPDIPSLVAAMKEIEVALKEEGIEDQVELNVETEGIAIRISTPFLFAPARAKLREASLPMLARLAGALDDVPNPLRVEGHTDNVPIASDEFPSNWELSSARAIAVLRQLELGGLRPMRLSAVGLSEYQPVADNATEEGRRRNRRVEIFVEYTKEQLAQAAQQLSPDVETSLGR